MDFEAIGGCTQEDVGWMLLLKDSITAGFLIQFDDLRELVHILHSPFQSAGIMIDRGDNQEWFPSSAGAPGKLTTWEYVHAGYHN